MTAEQREASDPLTCPSRLGQLARASDALALLVARNPTTTPAMLRRLARHRDPAIVAAVAAHTSTPETVALALAVVCPDVFAQSERGRTFLSDPSSRPPRASQLRALLAWEGAPRSWFERAAIHATPSVRAACAALAPALDLACVPRLARDAMPCVRTTVAARVDLPEPWVVLLAGDASPVVREAVARRAGLPIPTMLALARDPSDVVRCAAAMQPEMPADALMSLAQSGSVGVRWRLVDNPNLPAYVLEHLATPPPASQFLAAAIARHPHANERVSALLSSHADADYRYFVVLPARVLSPATWERLVADPSERVRHALAHRKDVPVDVLLRLATDAASLVRGGAASNERTPQSALERLATDESVHVRCRVAENPSTAPALHRALANDGVARVREMVAKRALDPALLVELARDPAPSVRLWVSFNPQTPAAVKQTLASDAAVQWHRSHG